MNQIFVYTARKHEKNRRDEKIFILGVSGMLGHQLFHTLSGYGHDVVGTRRTTNAGQGGRTVLPFSVTPNAEEKLCSTVQPNFAMLPAILAT